MLEREPRLRTIVQINVQFVYALLLLLYGWACWHWTSPQWWGLGLVAMLAFLGGAIQIIATVHRIVAIFVRERKIDAFEKQGGKVRGDAMASERALKDRGMI